REARRRPSLHRLARLARGTSGHCRLQDRRRAAVLSERKRAGSVRRVVKTLLPARTRGMAATTVLFAASWLAACTDGPVPTLPQAYTGFPAAVDPQCRDGSATIYDECGDQLALFRTALA